MLVWPRSILDTVRVVVWSRSASRACVQLLSTRATRTAFETKALEIQKQAKEKYPSFKWVSDGNITKIEVSIEDGKVILNNG